MANRVLGITKDFREIAIKAAFIMDKERRKDEIYKLMLISAREQNPKYKIRMGQTIRTLEGELASDVHDNSI